MWPSGVGGWLLDQAIPEGVGSNPVGDQAIFLKDVCFYVIASTVSNANADSYSFESFVLSRLFNAE